jgi:hypothetical protein
MCCTSWDSRLSQWWKLRLWSCGLQYGATYFCWWVGEWDSEWVSDVSKWGEVRWVVSNISNGTQCLYLQGSMSLWTIAQQATFLGLLDPWRWQHYNPFNNTVSHARKPEYSASLPWEPPILHSIRKCIYVYILYIRGCQTAARKPHAALWHIMCGLRKYVGQAPFCITGK